MCGICGQLNLKYSIPVDPENIKKMTRTMMHRGPDDEGYYFNGKIGLGFRRLSIIDLAGGHQPMTNEQGTIWLVFNGEIFNFTELKQELERSGHSFRTRSDTEVILHGYEQWGVDVLHHLNGMFGLALWDAREDRLMLARDRMGIKPVYYKLEADSLMFASEIRTLLAHPAIRPEVDLRSMYLYLRYRYTPAPLTLIQGVNKLASGTRLIIERGVSRVERWWNYKPTPFEPMLNEEQAEEALLELYQRSVKRHLISDVPLGILLSGGLDSGLLLALMREHGAAWKSYTVGFGNGFQSDEIAAAAYTSKVMKVPNTPVVLDREVFEATLPHIMKVVEEPITASSIVPMYHLCGRASEDVKVVLMGQGPDELFGGYKRHLGLYYGAYWRCLPRWVRTSVAYGLSHLPRNEAIKRGLYSLDVPERLKRYQQVFAIVHDRAISDLFQNKSVPPEAELKLDEIWGTLMPLMDNTDELGGLQFLEVRSSLPDELLMYADKLSMAYGLEVRVPYLDQEIVEFVERLPAHYKVRNGSGKWLHRAVCKRYLPEEVVKRKKLGFVTPVDEWLRTSVMEKINGILMDRNSYIYHYLRPETVWNIAKDHRDGKDNNAKMLFNIIALEEWMRNYLG